MQAGRCYYSLSLSLFFNNDFFAILDINNCKCTGGDRQTEMETDTRWRPERHKHFNTKRYLLISGLRAIELFFFPLQTSLRLCKNMDQTYAHEQVHVVFLTLFQKIHWPSDIHQLKIRILQWLVIIFLTRGR